MGSFTLFLNWQSIVLFTIAIVLFLVSLFRQGFNFQISLKRNHIIQAITQFTIFIIWANYYDYLSIHKYSIALQIVFALFIDFGLSQLLRKKLVISFAILPIVFSINFFFAFLPNSFHLQLLLVLLAIISKTLFVQKNNHIHIFNPTAFAMSIFALVLFIIDRQDLIVGLEYIMSFELIPRFYLWIALICLPSIWISNNILITPGSVLCLISIHYLFIFIFGLGPMKHIIHPNILLATYLLVTDPITTPKSNWGKLFFGFFYGGSILLNWIWLAHLGFLTIFDKLLGLPILNSLSQKIDHFENSLPSWFLGPKYLQAIILFFIVFALEKKFAATNHQLALFEPKDKGKKSGNLELIFLKPTMSGEGIYKL